MMMKKDNSAWSVAFRPCSSGRRSIWFGSAQPLRILWMMSCCLSLLLPVARGKPYTNPLELFQVMLSGFDDHAIDNIEKDDTASEKAPSSRHQEQPLLVIGAGLGRTGTSSLAAALDILGFQAYHSTTGVWATPGHAQMWGQYAQQVMAENKEQAAATDNNNNNNDADKPSAAMLDKILQRLARHGFNATTDFPSWMYAELLQRYPDAKVVLTVRSSSSSSSSSGDDQNRNHDNDADAIMAARTWARSFRWNMECLGKALSRSPIGWIPKAQAYLQTLPWMMTSMGIVDYDAEQHQIANTNIPQLAQIYQDWNAHVVATVPPEQLLIHSPQDGWEPLCQFLSPLDASIRVRCDEILSLASGSGTSDSIPYPHLNDTRSFQRMLFHFKMVSILYDMSPFLIFGLFLLWINLTARRNNTSSSSSRSNKDKTD